MQAWFHFRFDWTFIYALIVLFDIWKPENKFWYNIQEALENVHVLPGQKWITLKNFGKD